MNKNTVLPWGKSWIFLLKEKLDPQEQKEAMAKVGNKLYEKIVESLGDKKYFTLQLKWSRMIGNPEYCNLDANLIVTPQGVASWQKINEAVNKKNARLAKKTDDLLILEPTFDVGTKDSTKPPPPPPPPPFPFFVEDVIGDPGPFEYLNNQFTLSHVISFDENGKANQFNERHIASTPI